MNADSWNDGSDVLAVLAAADLRIDGRIAGASNSTLRCRALAPAASPLPCVYKPVAGERPLWDFPELTLAHRELASYELSEALGWGLVPPTAWRDQGPAGPGMCQLWIDVDPVADQVDVVAPGTAPAGWKRVLDATDAHGRPVELVHANSPEMRRIALFDAIANNADRKGGHVLVDCDGRVWAIDHGVTFSTEIKLRTVVWGWAGEPIPETEVADLSRLRELIGSSFEPIDRWLNKDERRQLRLRLSRLITRGTFPVPAGQWPAIPWPVF